MREILVVGGFWTGIVFVLLTVWWAVKSAARLVEERKDMERALRQIKNECGKVCSNFTECHHAACQSSYTAFSIAEEVLEELEGWPSGQRN